MINKCIFGGLLMLLLSFSATALRGQKHNYKPKAGYVPDAKTAIRIAEAVLSPIYGEEKILAERPFTAKLKNGTWIVQGALPEGHEGGVAEIWISKDSCQVLRVTHGM